MNEVQIAKAQIMALLLAPTWADVDDSSEANLVGSASRTADLIIKEIT